MDFCNAFLCELLSGAGYKAAPEIKLRIDLAFQLVPDVVATKKRLQVPYPTEPLDIVMEILSSDDSMSRLLTKCRTYHTWGFREVYVVDPATRVVSRWMGNGLEEVSQFAGLDTKLIWTTLDKRLA